MTPRGSLEAALVLTALWAAAPAPLANAAKPTLEEAKARFASEADCLSAEALAAAFTAAKKTEEGIAYFAEAARTAGLGRARAGALFGRGLIEHRMFRGDAALDLYAAARREFEAVSDGKGAGRTWTLSCAVHAHFGRYAEALAACGRGLAFAEETGDAHGEADALSRMGYVYDRLGEYARALGLYGRVVTIAEKTGDEGLLGRTLINAGVAHYLMGAHDEAARLARESLIIHERLGDRKRIAQAYMNLGILHFDAGDYVRAFESYGRSFALLDPDDMGVMAQLYNNMGLVHYHLGDNRKAIEAYQQGLKMREVIGDARGIAHSLHNIAAARLSEEEFDEALELLHRSLAMSETLNVPQMTAYTLMTIGAAHQRRGDHARAVEFLERAAETAERIGAKSAAARAVVTLAASLAKSGGSARGVEVGLRGLTLAEELGIPEVIFDAHTALGMVWRDAPGARSRDMAMRHYRAAVETVEDLRSRLTDGGQKTSFFVTKLAAYEALAALLLASRDVDALREAFLVVERSKARSLLDDLGAAKFARAGAPPGLMEEKRLLEARIRWLKSRVP